MRRAVRISDDGVTVGRLRPKRLPWSEVVDIVVLRHPRGRRTVAIVRDDGIAVDLGRRNDPDAWVADARAWRRGIRADSDLELDAGAPPSRLEATAAPLTTAIGLACAAVFVTLIATLLVGSVRWDLIPFVLFLVAMALMAVGFVVVMVRRVRSLGVWSDVDAFEARRGSRVVDRPMVAIDRFARLVDPFSRRDLVVVPDDSSDALVVELPPESRKRRGSELVARLEQQRVWRSAHPDAAVDEWYAGGVDDIFRPSSPPSPGVQRTVVVVTSALVVAALLAALGTAWVDKNEVDRIEARGLAVNGRVVAVDTRTSSPRWGQVAYAADTDRIVYMEISEAESTGNVTIALMYDPLEPDVVWRTGEHPSLDNMWTGVASFLVGVAVLVGATLWFRWHPPEPPSREVRRRQVVAT